jgi:hypothetical protein
MDTLLHAMARWLALTLVVAGFIAIFALPATTYAQNNPDLKKDCKVARASQLNRSNCAIVDKIIVVTNILSALVAVIVVGSLVWAGIQYGMAGPNPQAVAEARKRIRNALIALVFYIFMFSFLQWLVPGGIF